MIRLLLLCTVFFLLYLAFSAMSQFDAKIYFSLYDYQIETTIFAFGTVFLASQLTLVILLRFIFLIFNIPTIIKKQWLKRKLQQLNIKLLRTISELLMGNKNKALDIIKKILPELGEENKNLVHLIKASRETQIDKKSYYLKTLVDKKHFSIYAAKSLATIAFLSGNYIKAEKYALKAFNEDDTNTDVIITLIRIYAKLANWSKMVFIISKLQRADSKLLSNKASEIATYYYSAAKSSLEIGDDTEAIKLLESALELKPDYLEALNLFVELNVNKQNTTSVLQIINSSFLIKPSFEIALMYINCSKDSAHDIYATLATIVNPVNHKGLFLAIAAYLDLSDNIVILKGNG
jgi:uncharacterized membrane-anchored protein